LIIMLLPFDPKSAWAELTRVDVDEQ
jgi:hypothetical protein